jgi:hypothetical protein
MPKVGRWVLMAIIVLMSVGATACGSSQGAKALHHGAPTTATTAAQPLPSTATSVIPQPLPSTTTSVIPGACPPGCSLPADYDAITVLASSATGVAIVTVKIEDSQYDGPQPFIGSEEALEGNVVQQYPALWDGSLLNLGNMVEEGRQYLIFTSFDRGGTGCVSALFLYNPMGQIASLIYSDDGYESPRIPLPGRVVTVPQTITLAKVRARMYPTGGVVYPTDTGESWCPGP